MTTLYEAAKAHGEYIANHESDLYLEVNEFTRTLLAQFPLQWANATQFRNQVTGKLCFDIPFAYQPWWEARQAKSAEPESDMERDRR